MNTRTTAVLSDVVALADAELDTATGGGMDQSRWWWSPRPDQMNALQWAGAYWQTRGFGTFKDFAWQLMN